MRDLLLAEYRKMVGLAKELKIDMKDFPSVFNPKTLNWNLYFPQLLKKRLTIKDIKYISNTIIGYVIKMYNQNIIRYLQKKYSFKIEPEYIISYLDSENDFFQKDEVMKWINNEGFKCIYECMDNLCVDNEKKLVELIKITDFQLDFSTGEKTEDLVRWLFEIPLSYKKRLEEKGLLKKDNLTIIDFLESQIAKASHKPTSMYKIMYGSINFRGEEVKLIFEISSLDFDFRKGNEYEFQRPTDLPYSIARS